MSTDQDKTNGAAADLLARARQALTPPEIPSITQGPAAATTPAAPAGRKIDEADRLALENIFLQMQNRQLTLQVLEHQKNEVVMQMKDLQLKMEGTRVVLSQKYGIEIGPKTVDKDGTILVSAKT